VCGTFFTFSDYMKPAMRLAALMGLPVKYVFTHDSFRVGEDGPTHQPVEQEAQIRLLEKMKTPHGNRSMLVLRPADTPETVVAWRMALECTNTPCALLLSRQNIVDVPSAGGSRIKDAAGAGKGGYIALDCAGKPDVVLVANGSEVTTLCDASKILSAAKGTKARIVSVPSIGLFLEQSLEYRESVIPVGVPVFALTAGLPVTLLELAGPFGRTVGLERFGASAPYKVLDEKFGYTAEKTAQRIREYLDGYESLRKKYR
jgi:transketolase